MTNEEKILSSLAQHEQRLNSLSDEVAKINIILENKIQPTLQLLAEGQSAILEKLDHLAPKSRVEQLEEEVSFLKEVIRMHTAQINELKKAQ